MLKYIGKSDDFKTAIALLEVLELTSENKYVVDLHNNAYKSLSNLLSETDNPSWLINLLLESRSDAIREYQNK